MSEPIEGPRERSSCDEENRVEAGREGAMAKIHKAARKGQIDIVATLLAKGEDVDSAEKITRSTPLHCAAANAHVDLVRFLLEHGADAGKLDKIFGAPLHCAADASTLRALIDGGADPLARTKKGRAAIHAHARDGHTDCVEALLDYGIDIDLPGADGKTPLWEATDNHHTDTVRLLLARGADVNVRTTNGKTVLDLVAASLAIPREIAALLQDSAEERVSTGRPLVGESPVQVDDRQLRDALAGPDLEVARAAARALGDAGSPSAVDALVEALEGTDLDIRREAAEALGKIGDRAAVEALIDAMSDSETYPERHVPLQVCASNADARIEAARALGEIGDPAAAEALASVKHLQLHGLYRGCTLAEAAEEALTKLGTPSEGPAGSTSDERLIAGLLSPLASERERAMKAVEAVAERSDGLDRAYRASRTLKAAIATQGPTQKRLVEQAIEHAPSFSAALALLSNIHQWEDDSSDEALALATKAVAADTGDWLAWIQLGRVHVVMGNPVDGTRAFAEAVLLNPEVEGGLLSEPYSYLLPVYARLGMMEEADDAKGHILDGGTRLADSAEKEWSALVAAAPAEALRDALTGR
jgi:hypothetical protein